MGRKGFSVTFYHGRDVDRDCAFVIRRQTFALKHGVSQGVYGLSYYYVLGDDWLIKF